MHEEGVAKVCLREPIGALSLYTVLPVAAIRFGRPFPRLSMFPVRCVPCGATVAGPPVRRLAGK